MRKAKTREEKEGMDVKQREIRRKGEKNERKKEQDGKREKEREVRITRQKTEEN